MNIACIEDAFIQKKMNTAADGMRLYKKIWRKYHPFSNRGGTLVLIFPEADSRFPLDIAKKIDDYMKKFHYQNFLLIGLNTFSSKLSDSKYCIGTEIVTEQEMQTLLDSFCFCVYAINTVIISLDKPDGRHGSNILSFPGINKEDVISDCVLSLASPEDNINAGWIYCKLKLLQITVSSVKYFFLYWNPPAFVHAYYELVLKRGKQVYENLLSQYRDFKLCPAPYEGTGDVYVADMILKKYAERNNIEKYFVPVVGGANKKICALFRIESIALKKREMANLIKFLSFVGFSQSEVLVLHHAPTQLSESIIILDKMRNYKELDFFSMYLSGVFASNDRTMTAQPEFDRNPEAIDKLFTDNHLKKGKTVLIAPYNHTLPKIKTEFWVRLAEQLKAKGYTVCTNCGKQKEKPIKGTVPVFIPYSQIVPFLEEAGSIVAIRSGLCEIISSAKCRKVILYLKGFQWNEKDNIDYFSLNRMGLCSDAEEYTYQKQILPLADTIARTF